MNLILCDIEKLNILSKSWSVMKIVDKKVTTMQLIESPCIMQGWFLKRCIFFFKASCDGK